MLTAEIEGKGEASATKPTPKLVSLAFVGGRVARPVKALSPVSPLSVLYVFSYLPEKRLHTLRDHSKLTTVWSRGMARVTLSTGSTGVTSRGVPSASASSNASVPGVWPVTVNESTT